VNVVTYFKELNLKERIYDFGINILIYVCVIAFFITVIGLGYRGKHSISEEPNWYVAFFGFIFLLPFLIYFYLLNRKINRKTKNELNGIKSLIKNGIRSELDLTKLEITQNENYLLIGNEIIINKYGQKNFQTELRLKNNFSYVFYTDINKDNLKIYFNLNPKTSLFTDKYNKTKQYLDLEFLNK